MARSWLSPRPTLALSILLMLVLALAPVKVLSVVSFLRQPLQFVLAPIQAPVRRVVVWLLPPPLPSGLDLSAYEQLAAQHADLQLRFQQQSREVEELRTLVRDLSRSAELNQGSPVRQVIAQIIGPGADLSGGLLTVRAGTREGVEVGHVVALRGVHLFGSVRRVGARTSEVLPATHPSSGKLNAVIMLDDALATVGATCQLEPVGDGTFRGLVADVREQITMNPVPVEAGMIVRLSDEGWPRNAQMLQIGRIERVEQGQRRVVVVRPEHQAERYSEVMVRVPTIDAPTPSAATPPAQTPTKPATTGTRGGRP